MPRGRPKGSRNKKKLLNRDHLITVFTATGREPGEFLHKVMTGQEPGDFDNRDRIAAARILMSHTYDKPQRESELALIEQLRAHQQQEKPVYEIVYEQDQANSAVPAAGGSAGP